jgi:MYXO-CTERM domain-containing protein
MLKQLVAASSLVAFSGAALATWQQWGEHGKVETDTFSARAENRVFNNYYYFSLDSLSNLTVDLGDADRQFKRGFEVKIYQDVNGLGRRNNGVQNLVGTIQFDGRNLSEASPTSFSALLGPGNYYYRIHGTTSSSNVPHTFTVTSSVTAVPEPESMALALAGLGVAALFGRRRKASLCA